MTGLELPAQVQARLIAPEILIFKGVVPWGRQLIDESEKLGLWKRSTQVTPSGKAEFTNDYRSSMAISISSKKFPGLAAYERGLLDAFHSCIRYYKMSYNPWMEVTDDSGYEILRYREGERFDTHVDAIVGRHEGYRQLSGLVYLNDDYIGGELTFPRQQVRIKPEAGDIVLFPSNFCFPHASTPVTQGTKYVIVTWAVAYPKRGK